MPFTYFEYLDQYNQDKTLFEQDIEIIEKDVDQVK